MDTESPTADEVRVKGVLSRIRYSNEDGTFAICDLQSERYDEPLTIVGNILSALPGESVEVTGHFEEDRRYGRQLKIRMLRSVLPTTREGIERYLGSGLVDGIGPVLARRIVERFGEQTLELLDEEPKRLKEVGGIGKVRLERIVSAWHEQRAIRDVMVFLQSHHISPTFAVRIYKKYGDRAAEVVRGNPYQLAEDIHGIGFRKADAIARASGVEEDALIRLRAGVLYVLGEAHAEGHMYLPLALLLTRAAELLGELVTEDAVGLAVESLRMEERLVLEPGAEEGVSVWRQGAWKAEVDGVRHLKRLLDASVVSEALSDDALDALAQGMGIQLARAQHRAVKMASSHGVVVITGGPGTGKTTIVRTVVAWARESGLRFALAAPTGRAAKRMTEATGAPAKTLHRLLEFSFAERGFQMNDERQLELDWLIVDECSMLDAYLFHAIVRALPSGARLLLVGDVDQLPSVGPGSVLSEVIGSGVVSVVRLTEIFRQARDSTIVQNAHRINRGELPIVPEHERGKLVDFYAIHAEDPKEAQAKILELMTSRIPRAFGYDPLEDVQILAPMHRGDVGCEALNVLLQGSMHQGGVELVRGGSRWRVGDKVMQMRNNYELDVYNGDVGRIVEIDHEEKVVKVSYGEDRALVMYGWNDLDELSLAYAITVHKSQGSEYKAVILPMVTQHYIMLQRNLLYTAVTRAKELVIIVGTLKAVALAVKNNESMHRYTRMAARLRGL